MKKVLLLFLLFFLFFWLIESPALARGVTVKASWYGPGFEGRPMANGEPFKARDRTIAAHPTLKLGTKLSVKNPTNGRNLVVVVKDRGPFVRGRKLDLSKAAAAELGYIHEGVAKLVMVALK